MMRVKCPQVYKELKKQMPIFIAGSITGASDWQPVVVDAMQEYDVVTLNPRRDDWVEGDTSFDMGAQIAWEEAHLEKADIVFFYFEPGTLSQVTMLELGVILGAGVHTVVVTCPPEFSKYLNIQMMCARFGLRVHTSLDRGIKALQRKVAQFHEDERNELA